MPAQCNNLIKCPQELGLWTPALARPAVWLDAADTSTIVLDTGVRAWLDKSGNGTHATQGTEANQPEYSSSGFFGLPGITFDGLNDSLDISTTRMRNTTHGVYWVFIRRGAGSTGDAYKPEVGILASVDRGALHYIKNGTNRGASYPYYGGPSAFSYDLSSGTTYNNTSAQVMAFQSNTTGWGVWRNGNLEGTTNGLAAPNTTNLGFTLASQTNSNRKSNITMTEFILFETTDARLRQLIEGYLAWKWRLAHNLSLSHPYRFSPPRDNRYLKRRTRTIVSLAGAAGSSGGGANDNVTAQDVGMAWSVEAMTVAQDHVLAAQDTAFALTVDPFSIAQDNVLTAQNVAFALEVGSMAVDQDHVLTAQNVSLAFDVDTMALSSEADDSVTAQDVAFAFEVGALTIAQDHALTAQDVSFAFSVDPITVAQDHALTASDVSLSWEVGAMTVGQDHVLTTQDVGMAWTVETISIYSGNSLSLQDVELAWEVDAIDVATQGGGASIDPGDINVLFGIAYVINGIERIGKRVFPVPPSNAGEFSLYAPLDAMKNLILGCQSWADACGGYANAQRQTFIVSAPAKSPLPHAIIDYGDAISSVRDAVEITRFNRSTSIMVYFAFAALSGDDETKNEQAFLTAINSIITFLEASQTYGGMAPVILAHELIDGPRRIEEHKRDKYGDIMEIAFSFKMEIPS